MNKERLTEFIRELGKLCNEYDVHLYACSCCCGINVYSRDGKKKFADNVSYDEKSGKYDFEELPDEQDD